MLLPFNIFWKQILFHDSWRLRPACSRRLKGLIQGQILFFSIFFFLGGCHSRPVSSPSIQFLRIPPATEGGPDKLDVIEGRIIGAQSELKVVLYAKIGKWWIQPIAAEPFTPIRRDFSWTNSTHLGTDYAALLVESGFHPATTLDELPKRGGGVVAVGSVKGSPPGASVSKTLQFSGYEWRIRTAPSDRGGVNNYDASNAWTDSGGALHLRIAKASSDWTCAEVTLTRAFGYGTYSVTVRDASHLEPAVVFSIFTWDYSGTEQSNREMDIEMSRWGDPNSKNAQYVLQPFYVPENASRFSVPAGVLTHSFRWEPGRASFRTVQGSEPNANARVVGDHTFTSGVPSPGVASLRMDLYIFRAAKVLIHKENEVVVDHFEYLP